MLKKEDAINVASLFYNLDTAVRQELADGLIADERDCVSSMMRGFRHPFGLMNKYLINNLKLKSTWLARVNDGSGERTFGCDGMIIFRVGDQVKIGLFEAKWPRVKSNPDYNWDYPNKKGKISHFTSQIERQKNWTESCAIWEMFFYEQQAGRLDKPFDKFGSSCVKHKYAANYIDDLSTKPKVIWDNNDLESLIIAMQSAEGTGTNLAMIIKEMLMCEFGIPLTSALGQIDIYSNDRNQHLTIPTPIFATDNQTQMTQMEMDREYGIENFMGGNGISSYHYMEIEKLEDNHQKEDDTNSDV